MRQSCLALWWAEVGAAPTALCPGTAGMNRSSTSQDWQLDLPGFHTLGSFPNSSSPRGVKPCQSATALLTGDTGIPQRTGFIPCFSDSALLGFSEQQGLLGTSLPGSPPARRLEVAGTQTLHCERAGNMIKQRKIKQRFMSYDEH